MVPADDARLERERGFHNKTFGDGTRRVVQKYYDTTALSRALYRRLLLANREGARVLEYGCGPGSSAYELARAGADVYGIDISEVAIQRATERATAERLERRTHFVVMDAEHLDFPNQHFDLICGTGILHHLDLRRAYTEVGRTLKPGGLAVFFEPLGHNPFINLYRRLTPNLRTVDEHPLLMGDIALAREYFGNVEMHCFHFFSIFTAPLLRLPGAGLVLRMTNALDRALFGCLPFVRRYAWITVLVFRAPRG